MDIETIAHAASVIGGAIGAASAAAGIAFFRVYRKEAAHSRPVFENGEREAVRKALSLLGAANADYRDRIAVLEAQSETGRRIHDNLEERLGVAEFRVKLLWAERNKV